MNSAIQVLQYTHDQCVIYNPPSRLGIYFGIVMNLVFLLLFLWLRFVPHTKVRVNWAAFGLLYCVICVVMPLITSGSSDKAVFSRSAGSVTINTRFMLVPTGTKVIPLADVLDASVGGRNSWLLLNFKDGGQLGFGPDASLGGRENARDAINSWMSEYRGQGPTGTPVYQ